MDKMMKAMVGMLLEVDPDGIKKLAAKEFLEFITNKKIPFQVKMTKIFQLDMDKVISYLEDEDIEILHKELQSLHKCTDRFFKKFKTA